MQQLCPLLQHHFLDAPESTAHLQCLAGFLQRCQNYLSKAVVEQVIMRLARNNQQQFMQESGLRVRAYEQGFSTSAAAIIAADWALEHPHPIPPKVHVRLHHSAHMHLVTSPIHIHIIPATRASCNFECVAYHRHKKKGRAKKVQGCCQWISISLYQVRVCSKAKKTKGNNIISSVYCSLQCAISKVLMYHHNPCSIT